MINKKKIAASATTIFISLAMLGALFIDNEEERIKTENQQKMNSLRLDFENRRAITKTKIYKMLHAQGTIFLYTNDQEAQATWAPNINIQHDASVNVITQVVAYEDFIKRKDSLGFKLMLNARGKDVYTVNKNIIYNYQQGNKVLWFFSGDEQHFNTGWGFSYRAGAPVVSELMDNTYMMGTIIFLQEKENFKFYMIGYDSDNSHSNLSLVDFKNAVQVMNKLLDSKKIDTSEFELKRINYNDK